MLTKHEILYAFQRPNGTGSVPSSVGLNAGVENGVLHLVFMNPGDRSLFRKADHRLQDSWTEYECTKPPN